MKHITQNTFGDGMNKDLNPLTTPNSILSDALNATVITFNGNEFVLQNDMGNGIVERAKLSPGFLPLGVKEYGGIIYVASYNPDTQECELGSFPSPERDITGTNKIEYQTGLRDAVFLTGEYSIPVLKVAGDFTPEEVSVHLRKLNQQEVLQLSPGDMYVTTFEVGPAGSPVPGQVPIEDTTDFYDYFSTDLTDKKVFAINFYKIDDANNIKLIKDTLNLIPHTGALEEDSFTYYTENSKGSIVVGVELNTLSYFNASAREISRKSDEIKRVRVEALGETDSEIEFAGVRVDAVNVTPLGVETTLSFHIEKESSVSNKISMDITDLEENDTLSLDVTPYTQYGYLPKLTQSFKLQMGVKIGGNDINNIFKWRVNSTSLELDFDFKFETDNALSVYLEFYDMWSNYSVITTYPSPSVYSPMRLNIPLVDEPANTTFDDDQTGGTRFVQLMESVDLVNKPVMVNLAANDGKNLIRRNFELRKNHFYLVRICGIEKVIENGEIVETIYNDVYKGLYTTPAYNSTYDDQVNTAYTDPEFIGDFNTIPYPLEDISYESTLQTGGVTVTRVQGLLPPEGTGVGQLPTETVNGQRKIFAIDRQPTGTSVTVADSYNSNQNHIMTVSLANKDLIYGRLMPGLLEIITGSTSAPLDSSNIEEDQIIPEIPTESAGTITIPNITGEGTYNVYVETSTKRKVRGSFVFDPLNMTYVDQSSTLDDLLYKNSTTGHNCGCGDDGFPSCQSGTNFTLYRTTSGSGILGGNRGGCTWGKENWTITLRFKDHVTGSEYTVYSGENLADPVNEDGGTFDGGTKASKQFFLVAVGSYMDGMKGSSQLLFRATGGGVPGDARIVLFASKSNENGISNPSLVSSVLQQLVLMEVVNGISDNYYVNNLKYHENVTTIFKNMAVELTSKFDVAVKTYVFETKFKALGDTSVWEIFTTNMINNYISTLNTGHNNIVDELADNGFIPFADATNQYEKAINFSLPDITVNKGINIDMLTLFVDSQSDYLAYVAQLADEANTFDPDRPVRSLNENNEDLVNFAEAFIWANGELNIDSTVSTQVTSAITRYGGNTLRAYDKVVDPLFPL